MSADKTDCEAVVLFTRPWFGEGTKRFVGHEFDVGVSMGEFLIWLYKRGGHVIGIELRRDGGELAVKTGAEFESEVGIKRWSLS